VKKLLILAGLAAILGAFFYFDLGNQLTLENFKARQAEIDAIYRQSPWLVIGIFFVAYVLMAAASIPGAAIMTVVAGALFGLITGTIVVSFASTIGATFAFLGSRFLFRDWVQSKFGGGLAAINQGIEKEGGFYLFTLRLVPAFPFFVVNLLMGLTSIKTWTYYWVSQIGMLLATIVFVNAGIQIAAIQDVSDIASPALLASFAALGLVPWVAKWVLGKIKIRRAYAGYKRPAKYDRNMIVIGAGAAGLVSSLIGATVKAKVTLVEASKMGGDCLNYGCIPSKALIKSAKVAQQMRHADKYGLDQTEASFSFKAIFQRVHAIIAEIEPKDSVQRYTDLGVDVVQGHAKIIDPWTVEIAQNDGETIRLTTRSIVIAAGAEPFVPPLEGLGQSGYLTSDTMWDEFVQMDEMPKRIVVLGGGPVGCELSQAFARLGAKVTQVERDDRILLREDEEVSALAKESQDASGVRVLTGHNARRVEVNGDERQLIVEHDGRETTIGYDALIMAVGRKARLNGYGLEELGIDTDSTVVTDDYLATVFPNIFAAGDVAGPYQFTHTASHQAWYASVNALFGQLKKFKVDYRVIPWVTFTDPEIARVGLNEQDAQEQGVDYEVTTYGLDDLDRAITESETKGFVKVLTPPRKDKILGATIVGANAGELLAEYTLAMKHGLGLNKILGTIHPYPTMAEANKFAAGEWKRANKPEKLLEYMEKYHKWRRG